VKQIVVRKNFGLQVPGNLTAVGWQIPKNISKDQWLACGVALCRIETGVQWWIGDWWIVGENRQWGLGQEIAEKFGWNYGTLRNYGSVARAFNLSHRFDKLTFTHHYRAMAEPDPRKRMAWLRRAEKEEWSANQLKAAIARQAAIDKTTKIEFDAKRLGKFVVLYGDPPWRYENPPMGGSNRSIENQYPTMELEEICNLPVGEIAHENSVLFLWATSPKLYECMKVLDAWNFQSRTTMVWVKDKIGMGYHVRERHEIVLIAKRGELPPPVEDTRPDSVVEAPRLEHSAKPQVFYDLIDQMYPIARKIELFGRNCVGRPLWTFWGNQAVAPIRDAAE
jgi:N6-adenosine-specific RNA methylase IME4